MSTFDTLDTIKKFVELELKCGELEGRQRSAYNGLHYAQGKGNGWESSLNYAESQVADINHDFNKLKKEHQNMRNQYLEDARYMEPAELGNLLQTLGHYSSSGMGPEQQVYGRVYNEVYAIYNDKISKPMGRR